MKIVAKCNKFSVETSECRRCAAPAAKISAAALLCLVLLVLAGMLPGSRCFADTRDLTKKNLIYMAYDDSGSMYRDLSNKDGFHPLDRWSQAKYALEVFSSMMLDKDEIYIFPLQEYGRRDAEVPEDDEDRSIHLLGTSGPEERKNQIETHEFWYGQNTAYHSVKMAYEELEKAAGDENTERWLVILTDGAFDRDIDENGETVGDDNYRIPKSELDSRFSKYAKSGVNVVFLRIFDDNETEDGKGKKDETPTNKPDEGIYVYEAAKSEDTLKRLNEISNLIFKRQELSGNGHLSAGKGGVDINVDAPIGQLVVFAQGKDISVGDLTCGAGSVQAADSITIGTPQFPSGGADGKLKGSTSWTPANLERNEELGCTLATFDLSADPQIGQMHVSVSDTSNLSVYVRPAVKPQVVIIQDGKEFAPGDTLIEGEAELSVQLVNSVTGEVLDTSSDLLSSIRYDGIEVNGIPLEADKDRMTLTLSGDEPVTVTGSVTIEQSSYDLEETVFQVRNYEGLGELSLQGKANEDTTGLYQAMQGGESPAAVVFEIMKDGSPIEAEYSKAAKVDAKSSDSLLKVDPVYNAAENKWELHISCKDTEALFREEKTATVTLKAEAGVKTQDEEKTAKDSWDITFTDPDYVGDIQLEVVSQKLDGQDISRLVADRVLETEPCITFSISEKGRDGNVTPQNAKTGISSDQEKNGVSFKDPEYNEETGLYEVYLICGSENIDSLPHEGTSVSIGYILTAAVTRGDTKKDADPYEGTLSFIDPLYVPESGFALSVEPEDGISLVYQDLKKDPDSAGVFTVSALNDGKVLPAELKEKVSLNVEAKNEEALTFDVTQGDGCTWTVKPKLKEDYVPDFSDGSVSLPVSFKAELARSGENKPYTAKASGTVRLDMAENGVKVTISDPDAYSMRTIPRSEEDALAGDNFMDVQVTKDDQPLTPEEWQSFELTGDIRFFTKKKKELTEEEAAKTAGFHLTSQTDPEGSGFRIYLWADSDDLIKWGSITLYPGFTWRYVDYGVAGEEATERGTIHVNGLPWYILLIKWLRKYWWLLLLLIAAAILIRQYIPKELPLLGVVLGGRYFGLNIRKKSSSERTVYDENDGEDEKTSNVRLQFKLNKGSVLRPWSDIMWTVCMHPKYGKNVEIKVNRKNGKFAMTEKAYQGLIKYKVTREDGERRDLVVWGQGGAVEEGGTLATIEKLVAMKETTRMELRFRYTDTDSRRDYTDLRISKR